MRAIRNLAVSTAMLGAVALGGCASTGGGIAATTTAANVSAVMTQIQDAAVASCAFLPTGATVLQIIGAASDVGPATDVIKLAVDKVCTVMSPSASARRGGAAPTVNINGKVIVIHGRFVR